MEHVNDTTKKKQVHFSIRCYSEREERVINKIPKNGLFSSFETSSETAKTIPKPRPISLDVNDLPKYKTLPSRLKRQAPPIPVQNGQSVEKPTCPPSMDGESCSNMTQNGPPLKKPDHPPTFNKRSISVEPEQLRNSGKVALTIGAYEGEPKTPTRLDFLPQTKPSRTNSKASSDASSPIEDDNVPLNFKLQNELVATLKRSNLKKNAGEVEENGKVNLVEDNNRPQTSSEEFKEYPFSNGSVKKLASVLDQKLTLNGLKNHEQTSDKE